MMVQAAVSFVDSSGGIKRRFAAGDILELPKDVDWLRAGLVFAVPDDGEPVEVIETAAVKPAANAAVRTRKPRAKKT